MGSTEKPPRVEGHNGSDEMEEEAETSSKSSNLHEKRDHNSDSGNYSSDNNSNSNAATTTTAAAAATTAAASSSGCRPRHDSYSSVDSSRSPSNDRMKRRRTTSLSSSPLASFIFPGRLSAANSASMPSSSPSNLSSSPTNLSHLANIFTSAPAGGLDTSMESVESMMSAATGVSNMVLAHQIALDANFKLDRYEPEQGSVVKQVRDVMHQAFWDHLREQLDERPPVYTQAFVLLQEVRDQLLEITLPRQHRLRQEISDKLDLVIIKQLAEHEVLNFADYSGYVVDLMGKMCAPVRDSAIQALREERDVVLVFAAVCETLDLMRLDMANYTIQMIRPTIVKQIVEYERSKFKEFLKTQKDGLELTREWLVKHVDVVIREHNVAKAPPTRSKATPTGSDALPTRSEATPTGSDAPPTRSKATPTGSDAPPTRSKDTPSGCAAAGTSGVAPPTGSEGTPTSAVAPLVGVAPPSCGLDPALAPPPGILSDPLALRGFCNKALNSAYMELLQWPDGKLLPETVCIDSERVLEQRDRLQQICLLSSVLLLSLSTVGSASTTCRLDHDEMRAMLKRKLCPILDPAYTQSETMSALPNLIEQVVATLNEYLRDHGQPALSTPITTSLRHQLGELKDPKHRVTHLVTARCLSFIGTILGGTVDPKSINIPGPFIILQEEVARVCSWFLRFSQHNRSVFGEHYYTLVEQALHSRCDRYYSSSTGGSSNTHLASSSTHPAASSNSNVTTATSVTAPSPVSIVTATTATTPSPVSKVTDTTATTLSPVSQVTDTTATTPSPVSKVTANTATTPSPSKATTVDEEGGVSSKDSSSGSDDKSSCDKNLEDENKELRWDSLDLD